nr:hypothetical protein [Tanacetum cinerariifolium]
MALGYQNPFYLKQAQQKQQSLYNGKVLLKKYDHPVVYDSEETLQLAQESRLKMKQLNKEIKPRNYTKINHLSGVVVSQTAKSREELHFSNTFKTANVSKPISIPNEEFLDDTTPSVARKFLNETELDRTKELFENCIIKKENEYAKLWNDWINPFKPSREEKYVPNKVRTSVRKKLITVSQPHVITKKDVNSDSNGLSSTGVDNTAKTRKPQPMSNTKNDRVIHICLWCVDSGCSKHMTGNLKLLINFVLKFLGTVRLRNDHVAAILGFGDLQWGNILITRVYFIEGLGHNLFSTINLYEMASGSPICLMARATSTKSWLWHQRLSHLNFDTTNDLTKNNLVIGLLKFNYHKEHLCPSCEQGKSKRASHPPKPVPNSKQRLHLLYMDLYGPMRIASINGKRYVLVIMDDYSRYTWVHFLISKDEAPEVIKTFLKRIKVLFQSHVIIIRTNNGTEFKNEILKEYFDSVGIYHQASSVRTPQQKRVVGQQNWTLVEAARTILIFSRAPLFLWAKAIATVKPDISFLHVFGALCYPKSNHEDIGKLGAKGNIGFFIGYSADSYAYKVYNRRTKKIMETMNVTFDKLSTMAFEQSNSKPVLQSMTYGQVSLRFDLTYAPSTITAQQPTEVNWIYCSNLCMMIILVVNHQLLRELLRLLKHLKLVRLQWHLQQ